ncbi:MAG: DUF2975 domain-containing protein [Propionicimonas sp.]|nr:DUF2975 domain-containing protein [Propionicimonas sp.]
MRHPTIALLRVLLAGLMLGTLAAQLWFFPVLAAEQARAFPELDWLRWPMLTLVILVLIGVQTALVAIWVLLSMVEDDSVFSPAAFRWVDLLCAMALADTVLVLATDALLSFGAHANPPALHLGLLALAVCGTAFALLMGVMKGLLRKASTLTAELSEVI